MITFSIFVRCARVPDEPARCSSEPGSNTDAHEATPAYPSCNYIDVYASRDNRPDDAASARRRSSSRGARPTSLIEPTSVTDFTAGAARPGPRAALCRSSVAGQKSLRDAPWRSGWSSGPVVVSVPRVYTWRSPCAPAYVLTIAVRRLVGIDGKFHLTDLVASITGSDLCEPPALFHEEPGLDTGQYSSRHPFPFAPSSQLFRTVNRVPRCYPARTFRLVEPIRANSSGPRVIRCRRSASVS